MKLLILSIVLAILCNACGSGTPSNAPPQVLVQLINDSTIISDTDFQSYVIALQHQVTYDFGPIWGVQTNLTTKSNSSAWIVTIYNGPVYYQGSQVGGFHDYDHLPYAEVDAHGGSVTISHELLEMLADPYLTRCPSGPNGSALEEVVDPVASLYYIGTNGVAVEDFVRPSWFDVNAKGPYDFNSVIKGQYTIAPWTIAHNGAQQLGFFYYGGC